jgi:hypothetical protein
VKVCQEYAVDVLPANPELGEALQRASPGVEQKLLPGGLHQDGRPASIHGRHRGAGSEERHLEAGCC